MYYGGADTVVGLAIAKTSDLLDFVLEHDFLHEEDHDRQIDSLTVAADKKIRD